MNNGALTLTAGILIGNYAVGGFGSVGGNAEGGGMAVFFGTTTLSFSILSANEASGGPGVAPGSTGIGGGLFVAPNVTVSGALTTLIFFNVASTKASDISGKFVP